MSDMDTNNSQEPSVQSTDPAERKLARRIRIQRRLETIKKAEIAEDEGTAEKTETEKQIDASGRLLQKLTTEGKEVVSNIRVANDAREIYRREEDIAIRETLLKNLEAEAEDSMKKYQQITAKWSSILTSKDPLDINAAIQSQNTKCLEVLAQKDEIIGQLKNQLEEADKKFADDQKKQNEDIDILIERIDNQMNTIAKAYRRELIRIEETLMNERTTLLKSITKKWDVLYKERQDHEINGVERRREIMREYEREMNRLLIDHHEKYRAKKIWLETECQVLQQQVQDMKALCMINIEKLDYNYEILKRREDENMIVKNQQKRRINKLQDVVTELKKNYTELEESTRLKIAKLQEQMNKSHKSILELESKSNHFMTVNDKQYMQIWEMNTKSADKLIEEIFNVDKIIYEQMLGLDWEPPEISLLKKEDLPSYREAIKIIGKKTEQQETANISSAQGKELSPEINHLERLLLNRILKQISDQTGFFIEEKLGELLASHVEKDQIIIRLDNVFQALNIDTEEEISLLIKFFLPYTYCRVCDEEQKSTDTVQPAKKEHKIQNRSIKQSDAIAPCDMQHLDDRAIRLVKEVMLRISPDFQKDSDESTLSNENSIPEVESAQSPDDKVKTPRNFDTSEEARLTCDKGHLLDIRSENVIRALREFLEKSNESKHDQAPWKQEKASHNNVTLSRSITPEDMTEYWRRYREIFSPKKEKLWDALLVGLQKYQDILKERQKLVSETDSLRRQNSELRRLLESCKTKPGPYSTQRGTRSAI